MVVRCCLSQSGLKYLIATFLSVSAELFCWNALNPYLSLAFGIFWPAVSITLPAPSCCTQKSKGLLNLWNGSLVCGNLFWYWWSVPVPSHTCDKAGFAKEAETSCFRCSPGRKNAISTRWGSLYDDYSWLISSFSSSKRTNSNIWLPEFPLCWCYLKA